MKKNAVWLATFGLCAVAAVPAHAQTQFGAQIGYGTETDLAVGARVEIGMANTLSQNPPFSRAFFVTAFDYYFPDCVPGAIPGRRGCCSRT